MTLNTKLASNTDANSPAWNEVSEPEAAVLILSVGTRRYSIVMFSRDGTVWLTYFGFTEFLLLSCLAMNTPNFYLLKLVSAENFTTKAMKRQRSKGRG
jgi:hypothetical protein